MDVLDQTDGYFFHQYFLDDLRYACLGAGLADCRTSRIYDDPDNAGNKIFSGVVRQCIYPSRMAWIHRSSTMVWNDHICGLGDCGDAVGVIMIEE